MKKKKSIFKTILKTILILLCIIVLLAAGLFGFLTITEFNPAAGEVTEIAPSFAPSGDTRPARTGEEYSIITWNTGYGALGDNADFFMDGGSGVKTADKARVLANMESMESLAAEASPDFIFLQETDRDSTRSEHIDETQMWRDAFPAMEAAFANNFKTAFVPYPVPPIGKVDSGVLTLSSCGISSASRIQLPCPFSWPVRVANLKRCLLVTRIPVEETDHELVLVNLHLEAYDSGEGKIAQTKMLKEFLDAETAKGNYLVVGGDFNQTFSTVDASLYPMREDLWQCGSIDIADFGDGFTFCMDSSVPTCRSLDQPYEGADHGSFQYYMIDGFILSENVQAVSYNTIDAGFTATDHNPVELHFILN